MAPQIIFKHVSYSYSSNRKTTNPALTNVSFCIRPGSFTMVIGRTGSGKSTLIQQINGLLRPAHGVVKVGKITVGTNLTSALIKKLRSTVGLVFQIPQDQLFGETVRDDLIFGPRNFGFNSQQIRLNVKKCSKLLGINGLLSSSPFDLSGGQMKRVAIAGVLACQPKVIILDEPTVGLDDYGESHLMKIINDLRLKYHLTIVMVTHRMNLVAKYATQVLVLDRGQLIANVNPHQLFQNLLLLHKSGLTLPFAPRLATELNQEGVRLKRFPLTISELADELANVYKMRRNHE